MVILRCSVKKSAGIHRFIINFLVTQRRTHLFEMSGKILHDFPVLLPVSRNTAEIPAFRLNRQRNIAPGKIRRYSIFFQYFHKLIRFLPTVMEPLRCFLNHTAEFRSRFSDK